MKKKPITYHKGKLTRAENLFGKNEMPKKDLEGKDLEIRVNNGYWNVKMKKS